jgi:hypothetical protein
MGNVNSLFGKTTPKNFLDSCSTEARDYFSRLFARLDSEDLPYWMGTKGSTRTEGPPTGRDEHAPGKDAGSVRSSATGATEDEASCRSVRTRRPQLRFESSRTGFSVNRIFRAYPTFGSKLSGLYLRLDQVAEDRRDEVRQTLARLTGRPLDDFKGDKQISLSAEELSVEGVCEVVRSAGDLRATREKAVAETKEW